jgi:hypothetical protein
MALTDLAARKARPRERDYKLADEKGLSLLVRGQWRQAVALAVSFRRAREDASFGAYPEVGIAEARERRDAARRTLRDGFDPSMERKRETVARRSAAAASFEVIAREWHTLNESRWTPVHRADVLRSLDRDVFPKLGSLPLGMIDAPVLLDVLRGIERRGSIETAKRIRQRVSAVFTYAISHGLAREDPAALLVKALAPMSKKGRQPAVTDLAELRKLLQAGRIVGRLPGHPVRLAPPCADRGAPGCGARRPLGRVPRHI